LARDGRYARSFYVNDEECEIIKQWLKELRGGGLSKDSSPLRDIEKRLSALEARLDNDKLILK